MKEDLVPILGGLQMKEDLVPILGGTPNERGPSAHPWRTPRTGNVIFMYLMVGEFRLIDVLFSIFVQLKFQEFLL